MEEKEPRLQELSPRDEFREYVETFRVSSDRARISLYVVLVATVLMSIATYNVLPFAWPLARVGTWSRLEKEYPANGESQRSGSSAGPSQASEAVPGWPLFRSRDELKTFSEEYAKQFVARGIVAASPLPGVWIDINDLATVGGIALILLMSIFVLCIVREHENLHLALFKVRALCDADPAHASGDSRANLLYHGLAMRQVLSFPPTLARWKTRRLIKVFNFIFFAPFLAMLLAVGTNFWTRNAARSYGVNVTLMISVQSFFAVVILVLSTIAFLHARSMSHRWTRAFFRVNPARRMAPQMPLKEWLKIGRISKVPNLPVRSAVAGILDELSLENYEELGTCRVEVPAVLDAMTVDIRRRNDVAGQAKVEGEAAARNWCDENGYDFVSLLRFKCELSSISAKGSNVIWMIKGTWSFACRREPPQIRS